MLRVPLRWLFACLLMALSVIGASGAAQAASGWAADSRDSIRSLRYHGRTELLGHDRAFELRFSSDPTDLPEVHGVLAIELELHDTTDLVFPFADFEGPDAPALEAKPMRLALTLADGSQREWTLAPNGWIPEGNRFTFGFAVINREADSLPRQLFAAIAAGGRQLEIEITAPNDPSRKLQVVAPLTGQSAAFAALLAQVADVPMQASPTE